jgi:hypothetical protein
MKPDDSPAPLVRAVVACVALGVLMVSCGDDDDSSATTVPEVCADREALRSSVAALEDLDVVAEGTNGLNAAVADVKEDLTELRASASDELQPQVQAVQDAVDELETAADNLDSAGASAALTAVANVATSTATLLDTLEAGACAASTTPTT